MPASPVNDLAAVAAEEQLRATGILQQLGGHELVSPPFSADGERVRYASEPPLLGQHSAEILAEAETIDPSQGVDKAKARLRVLQERWEAAGKVPRDVMRSLEDRMGAVEDKVRSAGEARFARSDESPFTAKLREKVVELRIHWHC